MLSFLQKGKTLLHQQKDYNLIYYDTCLLWWSGTQPAMQYLQGTLLTKPGIEKAISEGSRQLMGWMRRQII